jgi:hypothetical protein
MKKTVAAFTSTLGMPLYGVSVSIVDHYSGDTATLYEDDETTTKANPLTTDIYGSISFKVRCGVYDFDSVNANVRKTAVRISGGGELYVLANATGATIAYGAVCRFSTTAGQVAKATNDGTEAEARAVLVCVTDGGVANGDSGVFIAGPAEIVDLSGGTAGATAYLSTSGAITTTEPTSSGDYLCAIGQWVSATVLHFSPIEPGLIA